MRYPLPDRMDEAAAQMARDLEEVIYGGGPDRRVEDLRRSILKDEYQPQLQMSGLLYFLDHPVTLQDAPGTTQAAGVGQGPQESKWRAPGASWRGT